MSSGKSNRLVILSGPSCMGKSLLHKSLCKFYPELSNQFHKLVLVNSRAPRPGEIDGIDYHFRTRAQVEALRADHHYVVLEARNDLQALNVDELESLLRCRNVFFEGNPYVARALQTQPRLASVNRLSIFLSPLSKEEVEYLSKPERNVSFDELLTDIMRRKLLRRARRQQGELSALDLENVETRASSAYRELQLAWHFHYVIPNHDGEDSENWEAFYYPIGEARSTLRAFAGLLEDRVEPGVEKWDQGLLRSES